MTTRIASTVEPGTLPGAATDPPDGQPERGSRTAVVAVGRGSHRRRAGMLVAVTLMVAVAVIAVVSSISTSRRADERRRLELAEVVGRYDAVVTNHDWMAFEPLLAPTFVFHNVDYGALQDRTGFIAWAMIIGNSYSDFEISVDDVQLDGDVATLRFHESGNAASVTRTPAAAGVKGVVRMRIFARQIVEMWSNYDEFGLLHDRALTVVG